MRSLHGCSPSGRYLRFAVYISFWNWAHRTRACAHTCEIARSRPAALRKLAGHFREGWQHDQRIGEFSNNSTRLHLGLAAGTARSQWSMSCNATYRGSNGRPVVAGSEASPSRSAHRFDRQVSAPDVFRRVDGTAPSQGAFSERVAVGKWPDGDALATSQASLAQWERRSDSLLPDAGAPKGHPRRRPKIWNRKGAGGGAPRPGSTPWALHSFHY
jgi:hypothetical protein